METRNPARDKRIFKLTLVKTTDLKTLVAGTCIIDFQREGSRAREWSGARLRLDQKKWDNGEAALCDFGHTIFEGALHIRQSLLKRNSNCLNSILCIYPRTSTDVPHAVLHATRTRWRTQEIEEITADQEIDVSWVQWLIMTQHNYAI